MAASPRETGPSRSHSCWIVGPPLRRIAPATPAPSCKRVLAAFTTASTSASVMSPCWRTTLDFQLIREVFGFWSLRPVLLAGSGLASHSSQSSSCRVHAYAPPAALFSPPPEQQGALSPFPARDRNAAEKRLTYQRELAVGTRPVPLRDRYELLLPEMDSARGDRLHRHSQSELQS